MPGERCQTLCACHFGKSNPTPLQFPEIESIKSPTSCHYPASKASTLTAHSTAIHGQPQKSQPAKHPSADILPGNRMVFNIKGNRYRLIVKIHYNTGTVFIRFIGTHADYDKIDASTI